MTNERTHLGWTCYSNEKQKVATKIYHNNKNEDIIKHLSKDTQDEVYQLSILFLHLGNKKMQWEKVAYKMICKTERYWTEMQDMKMTSTMNLVKILWFFNTLTLDLWYSVFAEVASLSHSQVCFWSLTRLGKSLMATMMTIWTQHEY